MVRSSPSTQLITPTMSFTHSMPFPTASIPRASPSSEILCTARPMAAERTTMVRSSPSTQLITPTMSFTHSMPFPTASIPRASPSSEILCTARPMAAERTTMVRSSPSTQLITPTMSFTHSRALPTASIHMRASPSSEILCTARPNMAERTTMVRSSPSTQLITPTMSFTHSTPFPTARIHKRASPSSEILCTARP